MLDFCYPETVDCRHDVVAINNVSCFVPPRRVLVVRRRFKTDHSLVGKICRYSALSGQHVCTKPMSNIGKKTTTGQRSHSHCNGEHRLLKSLKHTPHRWRHSAYHHWHNLIINKKNGQVYIVVSMMCWLCNVIVYDLLRHCNCAFN